MMTRTDAILKALMVAATAMSMALVPLTLSAGGAHSGGKMKGARFWGTWYGELDAEPFGLPPGVALSTLLTIHRDGSLLLYDAGDFGAPPISLVQSPQFGSWVRTGKRSMMATTLFFAGEPDTRDTTLIKRVRFRLELEGNDFDHLVGVAEIIEQLDCPPGSFPGFLSCPNPITAPDSDWVPEPGGAPNVRFEAWRLHAK